MNNFFSSTKRIIAISFAIEIIVFAFHYLLIINGIDIIFNSLEVTIVLFIIIGVVQLLYVFNKKNINVEFKTCVILAIAVTLLPVFFILFILSELH